MSRRSLRADVLRLGHVLAGLAFPAAKWQLIMHAEAYGADADTCVELWSLPTGSYPDQHAVLAALGLVAPRPARGYLAVPPGGSAVREHPAR